MFLLYTIVGPGIKLYFKGNNEFTTDKNCKDIKTYKTRGDAVKDQNLFDFDMQIGV